MLDDITMLDQQDTEHTLDSGIKQPAQLSMATTVQHARPHQVATQLVCVGMGGSALAGEFIQGWLGDTIQRPMELVKSYELPSYVGASTLVIFSSCSGSTEEVLEALDAAQKKNAMIAVISGGGELAERAKAQQYTHVILPPIAIQPRMLTFVQVRAMVSILASFNILDADPFLEEMATLQPWLESEAENWRKETPLANNYAKQLALKAVGKHAEFMSGHRLRSLGYKWKISWNENAKNTAFCNVIPEFNHNEFIGWSGMPVEKQFAIFDLFSTLEHPRVQKRFAISDRLLSGKRPAAERISLRGDTVLAQLCWGHLLADFTSIYTGILNGVSPGPVPLVTKLKQELTK